MTQALFDELLLLRFVGMYEIHYVCGWSLIEALSPLLSLHGYGMGSVSVPIALARWKEGEGLCLIEHQS
jgi:hypothetical protein